MPITIPLATLDKIFRFENPDKDFRVTCVGYAPSQGRRCQNPIAAANRITVDELAGMLPLHSKQRAELKFRLCEEARRALCRRYHQGQAEEVSQRWYAMIVKELERGKSLLPTPPPTPPRAPPAVISSASMATPSRVPSAALSQAPPTLVSFRAAVTPFQASNATAKSTLQAAPPQTRIAQSTSMCISPPASPPKLARPTQCISSSTRGEPLEKDPMLLPALSSQALPVAVTPQIKAETNSPALSSQIALPDPPHSELPLVAHSPIKVETGAEPPSAGSRVSPLNSPCVDQKTVAIKPLAEDGGVFSCKSEAKPLQSPLTDNVSDAPPMSLQDSKPVTSDCRITQSSPTKSALNGRVLLPPRRSMTVAAKPLLDPTQSPATLDQVLAYLQCLRLKGSEDVRVRLIFESTITSGPSVHHQPDPASSTASVDRASSTAPDTSGQQDLVPTRPSIDGSHNSSSRLSFGRAIWEGCVQRWTTLVALILRLRSRVQGWLRLVLVYLWRKMSMPLILV